MITYNSCDRVSNSIAETNDCTVKAIAIACNEPYKKVHAALKAAGRKPRKGVRSHVYQTVAKNLGYTLTPIKTDAKTINQLPIQLNVNKRYIAEVRAHALAIVHGAVEDWTAKGSKRRVTDVWEVTPNISKNAKRKAKRYAK